MLPTPIVRIIPVPKAVDFEHRFDQARKAKHAASQKKYRQKVKMAQICACLS